ncbi:MAG: hypothetical protein M3463_17045 [Verrucomicrobiota bacterium]|nr:hypothetical protein [Verrucomicrobiota bacterium]
MTVTKTIPAEQLAGLDVHQGDTLRVLAVKDSGVVIQIDRAERGLEATPGQAAQWIRSAKGSVQLASGESVDDLRSGYYAAKYGLTK